MSQSGQLTLAAETALKAETGMIHDATTAIVGWVECS